MWLDQVMCGQWDSTGPRAVSSTQQQPPPCFTDEETQTQRGAQGLTVKQRQGRVTPWSSELSLWWAFAQQFINLWVLSGPSESVTKLWVPCQDTCMQAMFCGHFWGSHTPWDLSMDPKTRTLPFSTGTYTCRDGSSLSPASGKWEDGRASRLLQACGSKAKARGC